MMPSLKLISEEKMTKMEVILKIAALFTVRGTRKVNDLVNNLDFKVGFYFAVMGYISSRNTNYAWIIPWAFVVVFVPCLMYFICKKINKWIILSDVCLIVTFFIVANVISYVGRSRAAKSKVDIYKTCWQICPLDGAASMLIEATTVNS